MRVSIRRDRTEKKRYLVLMDQVAIGSIYHFSDGWNFRFYYPPQRDLGHEEKIKIRDIAEKKCTTLNILRRLTS